MEQNIINIVTSGDERAAPIFVFSARSPAAAQTIKAVQRPHSSDGLISDPTAALAAALPAAVFAARATAGTQTATKIAALAANGSRGCFQAS